jgi:Tol biopolymer transport system component
MRVALVTAVLVAAVGCGGPKHDGKILLTEGTQLVAVRLHGSPRWAILPHPLQIDGDPVWSPDGKNIAFVHNEALYVTDAAGGKVTALAPLVDGFEWSPDSAYVVYRWADLRLVRADGSHRHVLVRCPAVDCSVPVWSPDGRRLAFRRSDALEVVDLNGRRQLHVGCAFAECGAQGYGTIAWSLDGASIALAEDTRFGCGLAVVHADGTHWRTVVRPIDSPGACGEISWSPDGALLALPRYSPSSTAIYRRTGATLQLVRLIDGADEVAWSPDGRRLGWIDAHTDLLWVAQPTGARPKRVGLAFGFEWSPDGTALAVEHPFEHRPVGQQQSDEVVVWTVDAATARHRAIWPEYGACNCGGPHWQPHG